MEAFNHHSLSSTRPTIVRPIGIKPTRKEEVRILAVLIPETALITKP